MNPIDANEFLSAFSLALDKAENQPFEHAQRTTYIALQIARELKLSEKELGDIYTSSLLHDIGITTSQADAHEDVSLLVNHCTTGADMIKGLPLSAEVVDYVRWHHANWDGSGPFERQGDEIPLGAQIVYLADRIDLRLRELGSIYNDRSVIQEFLKKNKGTLFSPLIVEAFLDIQSREKFWLDHSSTYLPGILQVIQPKVNLEICTDTLNVIANTFATIIDNKSPFTYNHSRGLAELALAFGKHYAFSPETLKQLHTSALLHDLGKLTIPNEILDKPGRLTSEEYQIIKSHPYYTKLILSKINGLETIRDWAGNHHETLDGKGYSEGLTEKELGIHEQIIALCDVYQALTESRPYRKPMSYSKAIDIISELVRNGKLSRQVFASLQQVIA